MLNTAHFGNEVPTSSVVQFLQATCLSLRSIYPNIWGSAKPSLSEGFTVNSMKCDLYCWCANLDFKAPNGASTFKGNHYSVASLMVEHKGSENDPENQFSFKVYSAYESIGQGVAPLYPVQISPAKRHPDRYRAMALPPNAFKPGLGREVASLIADAIDKELMEFGQFALGMPSNHPAHAVLNHARTMFNRAVGDLSLPSGAERVRQELNFTAQQA